MYVCMKKCMRVTVSTCMYVCMYEGMYINKLQLMAVCMSGFDIIVFSSISVYVCVRAYT